MASSNTTHNSLFSIKDLHCSSMDSSSILNGFSLDIQEGEMHALMGPNGSGKSTLASALLGNEEYEIKKGSVHFKGQDITHWSPEQRGKAGIFLAFQYPQSLPGVSVNNFLRQSLSARKQEDQSVLEVRMKLMNWMEKLGIDPSFADRFVNEGFSGGEKKRNEILQMAILEPELAILDETDSGLDIDALKIVAKGILEVREQRPQMGILVITHFRRLLDLLKPDKVHILIDGRLKESGDMSLAEKLEAKGYESWINSEIKSEIKSELNSEIKSEINNGSGKTKNRQK